MVEVSQNVQAFCANFAVPVATAVAGSTIGAGFSLVTGFDLKSSVMISNAIGGVLGFGLSEEVVSEIPTFQDIRADNCLAAPAGAMCGVLSVSVVTTGIIVAFFDAANTSIEQSAESENVEILSSSVTPNEPYQMKLSNGCTLVSV